MKVSYNWLKEYLDNMLPAPEEVARLLTFHSFEVESLVEEGDDFVFDIAILPNRAHDCLSHEGIAHELASLLGARHVKTHRGKAPIKGVETKHKLHVRIEDPQSLRRYMARVVENVKVGPSPEHIQKRLEALGQRSINNVVDIMNLVMLDMGQPLHAFDVSRISLDNESLSFVVRRAKEGEHMTTLDGKKITLDKDILIIADESRPLAIAGVKGGNAAEVTEETKHIVIESANFKPEDVRKTSRRVGIRTDYSARFENDLSVDLARDAIEYATRLLEEHAAFSNFAAGINFDFYPRKANPYKTGISLREANEILGTKLTENEMNEILLRLRFETIDVVPMEWVTANAPNFEGSKYKRGASVTYDAPESFDCSSFTSYLFAQAGISIPRISADQFLFTERIEKVNALRGDLVFSNTGTGKAHDASVEYLPDTALPGEIDHCGVYLGDGKVAHATGSVGKVVVEDIEVSSQFKNIVGFGRVPGAEEKRFVVTVPTERLDIRGKVDLAEEIGRVYGYEKLAGLPPSKLSFTPAVNKNFFYAEKIRKVLVEMGFSEVYTYAFREKGDIEVENPIAIDKGFLRTNLSLGLKESLAMNSRATDLLGQGDVRVFEIGRVFSKAGETTHFALGVFSKDAKKGIEILDEATRGLSKELELPPLTGQAGNIFEFDLDIAIAKAPAPEKYEFEQSADNVKFRPISSYPFNSRDIALFVPDTEKEENVRRVLQDKAGALLMREPRLFDVYKKPDASLVSYAYRLVFQSHERTLSDEEVNKIMEGIVEDIQKRNWKVR